LVPRPAGGAVPRDRRSRREHRVAQSVCFGSSRSCGTSSLSSAPHLTSAEPEFFAAQVLWRSRTNHQVCPRLPGLPLALAVKCGLSVTVGCGLSVPTDSNWE
jgi:hypothetical protein